jgi:hypothetical protein
LIHGHDLKGDHSLDDLGSTLSIARHVIAGILYVLQALWNGGGFFLRLLGDTALDAIPIKGALKIVGWLLSAVILPIVGAAFHFSYATALSLEKRGDDEKNMSLSDWCREYGQGKCAPYAPEDFEVEV